jgi:hypothetical protein
MKPNNNFTGFRGGPGEFKASNPFSNPSTDAFQRPDLTDWSTLGYSQSKGPKPALSDATRELLGCPNCLQPVSRCKCQGGA